MDKTYAALLEEASRFHGDACFGIHMGTRMAMSGLAHIGIQDPKGADRKKLIVFVEIDRCATDAIMAITGCRPGKRTMKVLDYGKMAATFANLETGFAVRVSPNPTFGKQARALGGMPDLGAIPEDALFCLEPVEVELRPEDFPGKPLRSCHCEQCGEKILDGREIQTGGQLLCKPCHAQQNYYRVLGSERAPALQG